MHQRVFGGQVRCFLCVCLMCSANNRFCLLLRQLCSEEKPQAFGCERDLHTV